MTLRPFLIHCLLLLLALPAVAQEPDEDELDWYEVEVIVFAHARGEYFSSETWSRQPLFPTLESAIDFDSDKEDESRDSRYREMGSPSEALEKDLERMERSSRYRVLASRHWRQPGLPLDEASPVRIHSSQELTPEPQAEGALPRFFAEEEETARDSDAPLPVIDGTITIERSRFLHIHADLVYRAWVNYQKAFPGKSGESEDANIELRLQNDEENGYIQHFGLQQQRKTRSKETQFLDHPMFGIIVHITPVEAKAR
ncbi:MAG: CsiV family protein [Pseudomonadota bacterium]